MIAVGIDIGMTGAVAAVDHRGTCSVADLPIVEDAAGKRVHGRQLLELLRSFVPIGERGVLVFEDVRVRNIGQRGRAMNHSAEGSLVCSRGAIQAAGDIAGLPLMVVQPRTWKARYGLGGAEDKGKAREIAVQLFPLVEHQLRRVKDHNRAEALLMARFALGVHS